MPRSYFRTLPDLYERKAVLIIGSDLLYERDTDGALAGFIACHASPAAEIWIIDPDRGNWPAFKRHGPSAATRKRS